MKILALQETDWISRNPIMHHRMLEELSRRGDEVTVIDYDLQWRHERRGRLTTPRRTVKGFSKYYADSSITLIRPAMVRVPGISRISWLAANWREIRRILDEHRPDVIVGYGISNALLGAVMARRAGVPFVFHLLDALHTLVKPAPIRQGAKIVEGMALRRANQVVVINRHLGTYAEAMGVDRRRITVLPPGHQPLAIPDAISRRVRQGLGVQDDELLLVFVGWLYEFSGLRELALALAARIDEFPKVKIAVVGTGDLYDRLCALRDGALDTKLLMVGQRPVEDIPSHIGAADVCLLPALWHPAMEHIVPAKVSEYMDLGKPVIATRLPGLHAEFSAVDGVMWVDSPDQVLDHVARLQESGDAQAAARALGLACQQSLGGQPNWASVASEFRIILNEPDTALTHADATHDG